MGKKPKARGSPRKAETQKVAEEKAQFKRFIETARSLGVDENEETLESAFKRVAASRQLKSRD